MLKAILHISLDEKFVAAADLVFAKAYPTVQNDFYLITPRADKLKFGQLKENFRIIFSEKKSIDLIYQKLPDYDLLVLHFLPDFSIKLVNNLKYKIPILWMVWGGEIYGTSLYNQAALGELSKEYFRKENTKERIKREIRRLGIEMVRFHELKLFSDREKRKALKKIRAVGTIDKKEYLFFRELGLLAQDSKFVRFTYYPLEYIFDWKMEVQVCGKNILVGNSATVTNNHLEVFQKLKELEIEDRKIIVPLSYGDDKYAKVIIEKGNHFFGKKFSPLVDFMPLQKYQDVIRTCSVVIMNHYRQQAVGNILSMLWVGAKVFLSEQSILLSVFKDIGCVIFSIEKDLSSKDSLLPLSSDMIAQNRKVLFVNFSLAVVAKNLKSDIEQVLTI